MDLSSPNETSRMRVLGAWSLRAALLAVLAAVAFDHYHGAAWVAERHLRLISACAAALMLAALAVLPPRLFATCAWGLSFGFVGWRGPLGAFVQCALIGSMYFIPWAVAVAILRI